MLRLGYILVGLVVAAMAGEALICHQCDSDIDERCGDEFEDTWDFLADCGSDQNYNVCQKVKEDKHGEVIRVIRQCGTAWEDGTTRQNSCVRFDFDGTKMSYCECDDFGCNW